MAICPAEGVPSYGDRYEMRYPLREWGLNRDACGKIIVGAGLPLPPKSACFFCPSMKDQEIVDLEEEEPVLFALAIEMQRLFRTGKHFRGDDAWTVRAVHQQTGEKEQIDVRAGSAAEARIIFRTSHDDLAKPFKYKLSVSKSVVGLGIDRAWSPRLLALATV